MPRTWTRDEICTLIEDEIRQYRNSLRNRPTYPTFDNQEAAQLIYFALKNEGLIGETP